MYTASTALLEALVALSSELPRRPKCDASLGAGTEVAPTLELGAELRGQDESTFVIQRVLKLANEQQHDSPSWILHSAPLRTTILHQTPLLAKL